MFAQGIGFSTGTLRNTHTYEEAVTLYRAWGCTVVEISPSHIFDVTTRPEGFLLVSMHDAPEVPYTRDDAVSEERLKRVEEQCSRLALDRVVLHPDHVHDWGLLKEYDIPWGVENLDARNVHFGEPEELAPIRDVHDLPIVLDINHCFTHDPSLKLVRALQARFAGRIVEQHVSGYRDPSDTGRHLPLCETGQTAMLDVLDLTIPTIIEIDEAPPEVMERELRYVCEYLKQSLVA